MQLHVHRLLIRLENLHFQIFEQTNLHVRCLSYAVQCHIITEAFVLYTCNSHQNTHDKQEGRTAQFKPITL